MVVDVHFHGPLTDGVAANDLPGDRFADARSIARHFSGIGIDRVVLSGNPVLWNERGNRLDDMLAMNAWIRQACASWPDIFVPTVVTNPHYADASCEQIDEMVDSCGARMLSELCQFLQHFDDDDSQAEPIIHRAAEKGLPILWHCSSRQHIDGLMRLAGRMPHARFIMAHMGGMNQNAWAYGIEQAARHLESHDNVWLDTSGGVLFRLGPLERAVGILGAERILFGVDFWFWDPAAGLARVRHADIPDRAKRLILGENARSILALD